MAKSNSGRTFIPITKEDLHTKIEEACERLKDEDGYFEDSNGYSSADLLRHQVMALVRNNAQVKKDFKVEVDFENFECAPGNEPRGLGGMLGFQELPNGLVYLGCSAGGDWELPVFFLIYWDGKKLRAYVPTEGNSWNTTNKQAYGNDAAADYKDACKRWPKDKAHWKSVYSNDSWGDSFETSDLPDSDPEALKKDIMDRIHPKIRPESGLGMWGK